MEGTAKEIERVLGVHGALTEGAKSEIRAIMESHLGDLEYFVLVREDSFGEIHTNRLREGIFFLDDVGRKCAQVTQTSAFFYPRNTGEKLIDVSTPVFLDGKKVFALRSGRILHGLSRNWKMGLPVVVLLVLIFAATTVPSPALRIPLAGILISLAALWVIWDRVEFTKAYHTWVAFTRKIGKGQLHDRTNPRRRDEFGQMQFELNKMALGMADIIHKISQSAQQVAASAEEFSASTEQIGSATEHIATSIQEVAGGAEKQAAETDEASLNLREVSTSVSEVAAHTSTVSSSAVKAAELAAAGKTSVRTISQQMNLIQSSTMELEAATRGLQSRSEKIHSVVQVIEELANQTNLLSLNAAIEAARAGEHGRGFSIVADEVNKLASASKTSAKQIEELVLAIQSDVSQSVQTTEQTIHNVRAGMQVVQLAGTSFDEIELGVQEVARQIHEISQSVQQMTSRIERVANTVNAVAHVATVTASGTQNVSAATEEQLATIEDAAQSAAALSAMAEELHLITERFHL